jgi:hypothetical protein
MENILNKIVDKNETQLLYSVHFFHKSDSIVDN